MKPFNQLTSRGRALRLRQMAFNALAHYDVPNPGVRLIDNGTNGIFRVDAANGQRYMLRVTRPPGEQGGPSEAHLRAEAAWLTAIQAETEIPIGEVVYTAAGEPMVQVSIDSVPEARYCMLFAWVPGKTLHDLDPITLNAYGELAARLHEHGATFTLPEGCSTNRMDRVLYFEEPAILFDDAYSHYFTDESAAIFKTTYDRVQGEIDALYAAAAQPARIVHGDLHPWNIHKHRGTLYPIDFEDLAWGHPIQDLAITLFYLRWGEHFQAQLADFRAGYERITAWPEAHPGQLEHFIIGRIFTLVNYVIKSESVEDQDFAPEYIARSSGRMKVYLDHVAAPPNH